jgi:hypothetical protein
MIKVLEGLFGRNPREPPAKKTAAKPKQACGAADFRAVSIAPSIMSCPAAMHATGRTYLLHEAPRLPLKACATPASCQCKFRKKVDRREEGDRRLFGATETTRWFAGSDNRKRGARRSSDGDLRR